MLAIDPGTGKCGMSLVTRDASGELKLLWTAIVPPEGLVPKLHEAYAVQGYEMIIAGGGTGHKAVVQMIREHLPGMALLIVDEKNTSQQARERYWEHHPRKGFRRLLPATLQTPPRPVDDFVAYILAERVLAGG